MRCIAFGESRSMADGTKFAEHRMCRQILMKGNRNPLIRDRIPAFSGNSRYTANKSLSESIEADLIPCVAEADAGRRDSRQSL